jgi:hypothetical protein
VSTCRPLASSPLPPAAAGSDSAWSADVIGVSASRWQRASRGIGRLKGQSQAETVVRQMFNDVIGMRDHRKACQLEVGQSLERVPIRLNRWTTKRIRWTTWNHKDTKLCGPRKQSSGLAKRYTPRLIDRIAILTVEAAIETGTDSIAVSEPPAGSEVSAKLGNEGDPRMLQTLDGAWTTGCFALGLVAPKQVQT